MFIDIERGFSGDLERFFEKRGYKFEFKIPRIVFIATKHDRKVILYKVDGIEIVGFLPPAEYNDLLTLVRKCNDEAEALRNFF